MKRRQFLKIGSLTLFGLAAGGPFWASGSPGGTPRWVPGMAMAAEGRRNKTLVCLFLRGGLDGLHAAPPYAEARYYAVRPRLGVPRPGREGGVLDLDGRFGLHPDLAPLLPLFREGSLAVVHAVGLPVSSRSHFQAQDFLESGGGITATRKDGWLNRYLQQKPSAGGLMRGLAGVRGVPLTLRGKVPVTSLISLKDISSAGGAEAGPAGKVLEGAPDPNLQRMVAHTFEVTRSLKRLKPDSYRPSGGARYPDTLLGDQLRLVAFLIKSGVGLEAVHAELDGFDTHAGQVNPEVGMGPLMTNLAGSLAAFWKDLGPRRGQVLLLTVTEFGRRVAENGSLGTDHGQASCSFVLGEGVAGGKVHGRWPGLAKEQLFEGMDLAVTTDYRDLLIQVAGGLGCPRPRSLFADYTPGPAPRVLRST